MKKNEQSEDPSGPKPSDQLHWIPFRRCRPRWERPDQSQDIARRSALVSESNERRDATRTYLLDELEQLRLGRSGISEQQNVDVSSKPHSIGKNLLASSEQQAGDGLLDV